MEESRAKQRPGVANTNQESSLLKLVRLSRSQMVSDHSKRIAIDEVSILLNSEPAPLRAGGENIDEQGARLRGLIRTGAPWLSISEVLRENLRRNPTPEKAAQLLELALVQSTGSDVLESFQLVLSLNIRDFYPLIHPKLRDFLVENKTPESTVHLFSLINSNLNKLPATLTEIVFIFDCLSEGPDLTPAWTFFSKHKETILHGDRKKIVLGLTLDSILYKAGRVALTLGYDIEARALFSQMSSGASERDAALQEILHYDTAVLNKGRHKYTSELESIESWAARLERINEYCRLVRRSNGFNDYNRPALNGIFKCIMDWIPATPEAWRAASELIIRNRDLVRLLPDMFSSFTGNACHYFKNGLDDALWSPWQENSPKEATEIFLYAVSLIHHFVEHYDADEKYLWQARAQFDRIAKIKPGNDGPGRAEFVAAQDQIKSTSAITEVERKRKLGCLRIAVHGAFSSDQVIDEYLETTQSSAIGFIDTLAEHAWLHRNLLTFLKIISRYSNITSLSPTLLNRTWAAAAEIENYDLAWRIATIAATRTGLTKQVRSHWEICGERRKAYNPQTISPGEREIALYNLPDALKRLFNSMFVLGPKLTELAGIMKRPGFAPRNALIPVSTQEKSIEKAITQSGFTSSGKRVMDRVGSHEISAELSTLVFDLDSGPWSYAAKTILERISAPCWGYEFDNLRALCRCLTPSLKPKERESSTSSLGRWFNKLSEEERAAWSDLVVAVNRYDGCEFGKHLARVVTRMATLIYPSHFLALSDLQKTKAPLSLIHDLESFVLSQKYTGLRFQRCIHIRIAVPEGLRRVAITE